MKVFWKIFGYFMGIAGAISLVIKVYSYTESLKPKPITEDKVKEIVKNEVAPVIESQQTILVGFLPDLIYNQKVLQNDLIKLMIGRDSNGLKILNMLNEFKSVELKNYQFADSIQRNRKFKIGVQGPFKK